MWTFFISFKYFFSRRREGMISLAGWISVAGVALGVASLIVVLSVMNGFDSEIRDKIIGTYSHVIIMSETDIKGYEGLIEHLESMEEVEHAAPFVTGQAMLRRGKAVTGLLIKGIDPAKESEVTSVITYMGENAPELGPGTIVLGSELMKAERILPGEKVELVLPYSARDVEKLDLVVVGSFSSGRYDYDANMGVVGLGTARKIFRMDDSVSGIGIKARDGMRANLLKEEIRRDLGYPFTVRSWMDLDSNLVTALAVEKKMMFLILTLIVTVACFNIASSLIMMVMEKTRDIGILKAIGANSTGVRLIFLLMGCMIGILGTVAGTFLGIYISERVNSVADMVERITGVALFPSDIYYFTEIPVRISTSDIFTVVAVAAALTLAAGIYPAFKASRLDPVEAIRYE